jgi:hypothetical protein
VLSPCPLWLLHPASPARCVMNTLPGSPVVLWPPGPLLLPSIVLWWLPGTRQATAASCACSTSCPGLVVTACGCHP